MSAAMTTRGERPRIAPVMFEPMMSGPVPVERPILVSRRKRTACRKPSRMGRPSKYTPETVRRILELLATGCTRSASAGASGISRETFCQWMKQRPGFAESVLQAEAQAEAAMVCILFQAAMAGNWRAAMAWLERRRPESWSLRRRCHCQQMRHMSDDEIVQRAITIVWPDGTEKAF